MPLIQLNYLQIINYEGIIYADNSITPKSYFEDYLKK